MTRPMLKTIFIIIATTAFVGCGDDATPNGADASVATDTGLGSDSGSTADAPGAEDIGATEDTGATDDTGTAEDTGATADADATVDTGPTEDAGTTCDPAAVAAETLGLHTTPAEATLTPGDTADRVTLDAGLGGAAMAAESSWVYVDVTAGELVALSDVDAFESDTWTLAFKRTEIRSNGEDSGPGAWMVTRVEGTTFDAASAGRNAEWATDDFVDDTTCEVRTEGRGTPVTAFGIWYDYDPESHAVSAPEGVVYVLYDAATHGAYRVEIETYADGVYDLRWGAL